MRELALTAKDGTRLQGWTLEPRNEGDGRQPGGPAEDRGREGEASQPGGPAEDRGREKEASQPGGPAKDRGREEEASQPGGPAKERGRQGEASQPDGMARRQGPQGEAPQKSAQAEGQFRHQEPSRPDGHERARSRPEAASPLRAKPRAAVCLVHGMGEHSGRYAELAQALAAEGIAVLAYDQRGHGRSPGPRGHADSMETLTADAERAVREAVRLWPESPIILYGHSMGGAVALAAALGRELPIAGLILTSPWLRLASPPSSLARAAAAWIGRIRPAFALPSGIKQRDLFRPGAHAVAGGALDPLCHTRITVSTYLAVTSSAAQSLASAGSLAVPTLLLHGTEDRVTSLQASEELAAALGPLCSFRRWERGFHELHHDERREEVIETVRMWIYANS
ncbi:alpha/beta fold hydrolase [Paenibacillus albicereus]|uniref:Alpha/beta fold hydrolase n=1 Tax=Paenibacillus albicereus TaxID=2726185 RepID=A0A6H2GUA5_9BACL|nr:alpha/beta hydrolase [Paenibacillus albicereus]QJC51014.1 alpha/beta fold hydrolase [Paenibacillus albicereus]